MSTRPEPDSYRERSPADPATRTPLPDPPPPPRSTSVAAPQHSSPHRYSQQDQPPVDPDYPAAPPTASDRREVLDTQRQRYGGIKWGSAFFGWLTATGTALLLTALAVAAGTAFGLAATPVDPGQAVDEAARAGQNADVAPTAGLISAVVVLVILFLAYFCGGYVAGRMARFNGAKQGLAVWVWAIVIAVLVAVLAAVAGSQFNILATLNGQPRLPINEGALTTGGIIAALVAVVASLGGAVLGGLAGMRFHRKVDRAAFDR
jgi:hypothetical protein